MQLHCRVPYCHINLHMAQQLQWHSDHFMGTWVVAEWYFYQICSTMENRLWNGTWLQAIKPAVVWTHHVMTTNSLFRIWCHLEKMVSILGNYLRKPLSLFDIQLSRCRQEFIQWKLIQTRSDRSKRHQWDFNGRHQTTATLFCESTNCRGGGGGLHQILAVVIR